MIKTFPQGLQVSVSRSVKVNQTAGSMVQYKTGDDDDDEFTYRFRQVLPALMFTA